MSAILSADDLNDFITPGVACIKPIETLPAAAPTPSEDDPYEIKTVTKPSAPSNPPPAEISLTDCLACSGCVTSAEAVLVSLQSHSEVLNMLDEAPALDLSTTTTTTTTGPGPGIQGLENEKSKILVASVSPQSRASIAATFGIAERQAAAVIEQLLSGDAGLRSGGKYGNGFHWVFDTNPAREACLVLGAEEVIDSLSASTTATGKTLAKTLAATDTSSKSTTVASRPSPSGHVVTRPILASSCPGWICYAEKTHPHVLPHLSRLKSPQALTGTLLKTTLSCRLGVSPDRIWHVAVMPCFDKKLEASREELTDVSWAPDRSQPPSSSSSSSAAAPGAGRGVRDVDCVITSKELLMLADSRGINLAALPRTPLPSATRTPFPDAAIEQFLRPGLSGRTRRGRATKADPQRDPAAGTSGGNLHYTLQYFAARHPGSSIQVTPGRNSDTAEYRVVSAGGETLLAAARYYGFRNIQNLVRRLKPSRLAPGMSGGWGGRAGGAAPVARRPNGRQQQQQQQLAGPGFAYVEVMACPGGCTNGGGQVKVDDPVVAAGSSSSSRRPGGGAGSAGPQEQKRWLAQVDEAYFSGEDENSNEDDEGSEMATEEDGDAMDVVDDADDADDWVGGISPSYVKRTLAYWSATTGVGLDRLAYTSYRAVVSDVGKDKIPTTQRVIELASKAGGGW